MCLYRRKGIMGADAAPLDDEERDTNRLISRRGRIVTQAHKGAGTPFTKRCDSPRGPASCPTSLGSRVRKWTI
ncbi:hypothetical protein CONPUDRAFT_85666 [Coniophora puteana RWD-64-598 SS2]|uniref:Uncharacterized protein n=1 Tax=Coniophora puteana (strain RWD-64-598) TaxID=741705 RepID=A0A5M3M6K7_CONPW|nr:uncharacterized protein CONPUDRAFT_85666 [Coniophora puteana RWD-64-598 SS2]EIW74979.1 hypothetical protein CONPUDRAFT_85666 [Coniophora puteana RWD-64-598 SS2]